MRTTSFFAAAVWIAATGVAWAEAPADEQAKEQAAAQQAMQAARDSLTAANAANAEAGKALQEARGVRQEALDARRDADAARQTARAAAEQADAAKAQAELTARGVEAQMRAVGRGPSSQETLVVGARTLTGQVSGKVSPPMLSEQLDGCLWPGPPGTANDFACVARTVRTAARSYRRVAGDRQRAADSYTVGSTAGLTVAAAGVDHAAKDTIRAWGVAGLLPVVFDDLAQPGPRARLYSVAATAMTVISLRAETLKDAQAELARTLASTPTDNLALALEATCGEAALQQLNARAKTLKKEEALADEAVKLNGVIEARCAELRSGLNRLQATDRSWGVSGRGIARGLAADAAVFDDSVTRLDRVLRAGSADVLKVVFKVPFNMAAKIVDGQMPPQEYTGRALEVFTATYTFNLERLPDAAIPDPVGARIGAPSAKLAAWSGSVNAVNLQSERLNMAIAAAQLIKSVNNQSILTVRPGSMNQPITLTTPSN
jgi:hypothetical protein